MLLTGHAAHLPLSESHRRNVQPPDVHQERGLVGDDRFTAKTSSRHISKLSGFAKISSTLNSLSRAELLRERLGLTGWVSCPIAKLFGNHFSIVTLSTVANTSLTRQSDRDDALTGNKCIIAFHYEGPVKECYENTYEEIKGNESRPLF